VSVFSDVASAPHTWGREEHLREFELIDEIKEKLEQTRNLAIQAGGFMLFYLIEMALLETKEMSAKHRAVKDGQELSVPWGQPSNRRPKAAPPPMGGRFTITYPDRWKYPTKHLATP
jgi:hypothetical protein